MNVLLLNEYVFLFWFKTMEYAFFLSTTWICYKSVWSALSMWKIMTENVNIRFFLLGAYKTPLDLPVLYKYIYINHKYGSADCVKFIYSVLSKNWMNKFFASNVECRKAIKCDKIALNVEETKNSPTLISSVWNGCRNEGATLSTKQSCKQSNPRIFFGRQQPTNTKFVSKWKS